MMKSHKIFLSLSIAIATGLVGSLTFIGISFLNQPVLSQHSIAQAEPDLDNIYHEDNIYFSITRINSMNLNFIFINFLLLNLIHLAFVQFTTPSSMIQPVLYGVFCIAAIAYFLGLRFLLESYLSKLRYFGCLLLGWIGFTLLWSVGIVSGTQVMSELISMQQKTEATLFYGTSGTQFLFYKDMILCWIIALPIIGLSLAINLLFKKWLR